MNSRKVRRTKDKGQSSARLAMVVVGLAAMAVFAGCDWLLGADTTPPTCQITSPPDSASVNGAVPIAATAFDSVGVERVEFYADGAVVGTDSSLPYSASWDASSLAEGSWHSLSCIAYDLAQNQGFSDTIAVVIGALGPTSVFHGQLEVQAHSRKVVSFDANAGDTLSGEARVVSGGTLASLMWLDRDNYQKYIANQSYTALFRQDNFAQMSMRQSVASTGGFYLVFVNNASSAVTCWARFVLE